MTARRVTPAGVVAALVGALLLIWVWFFRYNDLDRSEEHTSELQSH